MNDEMLRGYLLEFTEVDELLNGAKAVAAAGYCRIEVFTPFPIPAVNEFLPPSSNPIAPLIFLGGLLGGLTGYGIQYYTAVISYPILSGGKPMHAWPAFIPVTFELIVLFAAVTGFLAALWVNGLPRLNHPVFAIPDFNLVSRDRFFLFIDAEDERFQPERTRQDIEQVPTSNIFPVNLQ